MSSTIGDVRDAIKTALDTIDGLNVSEYETNQISPPQADISTPQIEYDYTFAIAGGGELYTITVLSSTASAKASQDRLDEYASPTGARSVKAALESDITLGGVVDSVAVKTFRPLGIESIAALGYRGGEFAVEIIRRT